MLSDGLGSASVLGTLVGFSRVPLALLSSFTPTEFDWVATGARSWSAASAGP